MNTSKFIGCIMILIGTTIGAGILALSTESAAAGFPLASILIVAIGILTIITGLMIIEVNLALPSSACSFSSMAQQTLGTFGRVITWLSYLFLLYLITWAYISGGTSLITNTVGYILPSKIPAWISAISFTLILGLPVFLGTKTVDYFNRGLISLKGFLLLATLALILPHIDINKIIATQNIQQIKYLWIATPVIILSFFYHSVIPSLRIYIGDKPQTLKNIVIYGATACLIVYLLWLATNLGVVPLIGDNSFTSLAQNGDDVGEFAKTISTIINNKWVTSGFYGFSNIAMTTSFLGVTLSLFDFLADGFKIPDTRSGRSKTAILTFTPPLALALLYPKGFILALNYTSVFVAIISIVLPPLMVYRLRKSKHLKSPYRIFGGNTLLALVFTIGIALLILSIMASFNLLPSIKN